MDHPKCREHRHQTMKPGPNQHNTNPLVAISRDRIGYYIPTAWEELDSATLVQNGPRFVEREDGIGSCGAAALKAKIGRLSSSDRLNKYLTLLCTEDAWAYCSHSLSFFFVASRGCDSFFFLVLQLACIWPWIRSAPLPARRTVRQQGIGSARTHLCRDVQRSMVRIKHQTRQSVLIVSQNQNTGIRQHFGRQYSSLLLRYAGASSQYSNIYS